MELQTIKERVLFLIHELNLSVAKFERTVGWSVGYVSTIKESFKLKKANEIKKVFKNVNIKFIMTGKGKLFRNSPDAPLYHTEDTYEGRFKKLVAQLRDKGLITNQTDLAKKLGYNSSYLSTIANNRKKVPSNFIEKLKQIDETIDGEWLLKQPENEQPAEDAQQTVIDAVNALPDTNVEPADENAPAPEETPATEEQPAQEKQKRRGRKVKKAKEEKPKEEKLTENKPKEEKAKEEKVLPKEEKKAAQKLEPQPSKPLSTVDELLLQNRMFIEEFKKQGERMDVLLAMLKSKI